MKKWVTPVLIAILFVGIVANGYLYSRQAVIIQNNEARVAGLQADVAGIEERINSVTGTIQTLTGDVSGLSGSVGNLQADVASIEEGFRLQVGQSVAAIGNALGLGINMSGGGGSVV